MEAKPGFNFVTRARQREGGREGGVEPAAICGALLNYGARFCVFAPVRTAQLRKDNSCVGSFRLKMLERQV